MKNDEHEYRMLKTQTLKYEYHMLKCHMLKCHMLICQMIHPLRGATQPSIINHQSSITDHPSSITDHRSPIINHQSTTINTRIRRIRRRKRRKRRKPSALLSVCAFKHTHFTQEPPITRMCARTHTNQPTRPQSTIDH